MDLTVEVTIKQRPGGEEHPCKHISSRENKQYNSLRLYLAHLQTAVRLLVCLSQTE